MENKTIKKLTKIEFFDVYGISLLLKETTDSKIINYLAWILNSIAQKYYEISKFAVISELRYFRRGGGSWIKKEFSETNLKLLERLKIKDWRKRKQITLEQAEILLNEGEWDEGTWGGMAWLDICRTVLKLKTYLPVTKDNINKVLIVIDRLNDLEHNNNLYLVNYCTFDLEIALNDKASYNQQFIMNKCSKEIKQILEESV